MLVFNKVGILSVSPCCYTKHLDHDCDQSNKRRNHSSFIYKLAKTVHHKGAVITLHIVYKSCINRKKLFKLN